MSGQGHLPKHTQFSSATGNSTMNEQAGDIVVEAEDPTPGKYTVQADESVGDKQKVGRGQAEDLANR